MIKGLLRIEYFLSLIFSWILISGAYGSENFARFKVKYISSGNIYIDGGAADSVMVGDSLRVVHGDSVIANLEVSFTAQHSSSCRVIDRSADIQVGDIVLAILKKIERNVTQPVADTTSLKRDDSKLTILPKAKQEKNQNHLSGRVAVNYFAWKGLQESDLDFKRPGLELRLTVRNLWGSGYSLNVRTSARYNQREKRYTNDVSQNEFRNRIYEFSINNEDNESFGVRFGRIIPRDMSGVGYIDGFMVNRNFSKSIRLGAFGGAQPEWQYANPQTSLQKYGLFISGTPDRLKGFKLESTLAMVGEYHSFDVSREFIHIRNLLENEKGFNIYQSADIDVNRSWRHDKTSEMIVLTSFYVSTRYRFSPKINAGISFDSRKRYWNYEQKLTPDSLFDDLSRRGLKATLDVKLPAAFGITANFGMRNREHFSKTASSYSIGISKTNITRARIRLNFGVAGFSSQYSDGLRLSYDMGKYSRRGDYLAIGYGIYRYSYKSLDTTRSSRWIQGKCTVRLLSTVMVSADFQRSIGDDIDGLTIMGDIGYSFR